MPSLDDELTGLRARVGGLKKAFKTKASKVWPKRRTVGIEMLLEQARMECEEHTDWIERLNADYHEHEGQLGLSVLRSNAISYAK